MDITNRRHLHAVAKDRLEKSRELPRTALVYGGLVVLTSFLATTVSFVLGRQISNFGGLANLGTRSILSTVQTILPIGANLFLMALELGFLNAMLRVSRQQYASPQSLRMGFERFWALLKVTLLQSGLYLAATVASTFIASQIFAFTPMSRNLMGMLAPMVQPGATVDPAAMLEDPAFVSQMTRAMLPLFVLMGLVLIAIALPLFFHYRMVNYIIIDKPGIPSLMAMQESWGMMRRNCFKLFRVDLSMWWYYLAMLLSLCIGYGDTILGLLGVSLPFSPTVSYFFTLILYLIANLALILFLRPHVEITYALVYDALRPEPPRTEGAVLGNIFNM